MIVSFDIIKEEGKVAFFGGYDQKKEYTEDNSLWEDIKGLFK